MDVFVIIAAVLLAISFLAFIVYSAKGGNLLIGLLITATLWLGLGATYNLINSTGGNPWNSIMDDMTRVFQTGPANYGGTIAIIIFASWFGRVLVDTGIAKALIKKVVELAGSRQLVTVIAVGVVSALMFTSIFGAGSVIAMGSIVLPILFAMGVNKKLAVGTFIMSVAAGMYVNGGYISQFSGHAMFKEIWNIPGFVGNFTAFTWAAFGVHVLVMLAFIFVTYFLSKGKVRSWAMEGEVNGGHVEGGLEPQKISSWTFLVPFIPIVLALVIAIINIFVPNDLSAIPVNFGFILGAIIGLLVTGNLKTYRKAVRSMQQTLLNGISDVALLIGMLLVLNMFSTSAQLVSPIIQEVLGTSMNWITSNSGMWIITIVFIVLAPLALFRGPFMIWGSGIALASVLFAILGGATGAGSNGLLGAFPLLLALFYVQPVGMVANSCPTQSWNMWALAYSKYDAKTFIKANVLWSWIIVGVNILLAFLLFGKM